MNGLIYVKKKKIPEFKIYQPILVGIFFRFATIKIVNEPKQQILILARIESLESLYLHSCTTFKL